MARINLQCNLPDEDQERIMGYFDGLISADEEDHMSACFRPYLFFDGWGTRNMRECSCTYCGTFQLYKEENPQFFRQKHGDVCDCPNCGDSVTLVALGRMTTFGSINDEALRFTIFRPAPDGGLLLISGWGRKHYSFNDLSPTVNFSEHKRVYLAPGKRMQWNRHYEYGWPKYALGWDPHATVTEPFNPAMMVHDGSYYPINAARISDTDLKYCQLAQWFMERCTVDIDEPPTQPLRYLVRYLSAYTAYPYMEMAMKLGLTQAVDDLVLEGRKNADVLNWNSKSSWGFLRLSKPDSKTFLSNGGGLPLLRAYKQIRKESDIQTMSQLIALMERVNGSANAGMICRSAKLAGCTITEAVNYLERHRDLGRMNTVTRMWADYLDMAVALEYDLSRRDVALPKDLLQRHDNAAATIGLLHDQIEAAKYAKLTERLRKMYEFECGGYCIVVPSSPRAIVEEGKTLKHCVGGYAARHFDGAVVILFLRNARKKGTPFITLELKPRKGATDPVKIVQIHGYRNDWGRHKRPEEKFGWFLGAWTAWLRSGSKRDSNGRPILPEGKEKSA